MVSYILLEKFEKFNIKPIWTGRFFFRKRKKSWENFLLRNTRSQKLTLSRGKGMKIIRESIQDVIKVSVILINPQIGKMVNKNLIDLLFINHRSTIPVTNFGDQILVSTNSHALVEKRGIHIPTRNWIRPSSFGTSAVMLSQKSSVIIMKASNN